MLFSHSRSLRRAAQSSDAQRGLMRDFGFGTIPHVEHRAQVVYATPNHQVVYATPNHLSRLQDKLRKNYDEVISLQTNDELSDLLAALDRAA